MKNWSNLANTISNRSKEEFLQTSDRDLGRGDSCRLYKGQCRGYGDTLVQISKNTLIFRSDTINFRHPVSQSVGQWLVVSDLKMDEFPEKLRTAFDQNLWSNMINYYQIWSHITKYDNIYNQHVWPKCPFRRKNPCWVFGLLEIHPLHHIQASQILMILMSKR